MTQFADRMKAHLAEYKRTHLSELPDGVWRSNKRSYAHILPEEHRRLNILAAIREEFWAYFEAQASDYALHTDFHHLNSSQAFAFNLFFYWMRRSETQAAFLRALGVSPKNITTWRFEHMPDQLERTTVDFHAVFDDGSHLLVEVKLTESHFGGGLPNDTRRAKLNDTYGPRLKDKIPAEYLEEAKFFLHYQLLRNLSHLDKKRGDTLVILLPRANEFTWLEAETFVKLISPSCRSSVHLVAVEDLLFHLARECTDEDAGTYLRQLSEKYVVPGAGPEHVA